MGEDRHPSPLRDHLMPKNVHIIGAGISGLSAAVRLANANYTVHVHEATQQAGGRCRSYFDGATNLTIDNGNHLLLSGNSHARAYARSIGTEAGLVGPERAQFPFVDLKTGQRWQIDLGDGRLPTWGLDESRRVPDTGLTDYLKLAPLIWASEETLVGKSIPCEGVLYQRLVQPLLLAALNVDPPEGSAGVGGAGGGGRRDRAGDAARRRAGLPSPDRARRAQRSADRACRDVPAGARAQCSAR